MICLVPQSPLLYISHSATTWWMFGVMVSSKQETRNCSNTKQQAEEGEHVLSTIGDDLKRYHERALLEKDVAACLPVWLQEGLWLGDGAITIYNNEQRVRRSINDS